MPGLPPSVLVAVVLLAIAVPIGGPRATSVGSSAAAPVAVVSGAASGFALQHHDRLVTVPLNAGPRHPSSAYGPSWMAYDHADRSMFVAVAPNSLDEVGVSWSPSANATIAVGSDPFAVAVDNGTGQVFVTNSGSNNVTVVNDTTLTVVSSIAVGSQPFGVTFDPATGLVFVANNGSNNVSVISPTKGVVVASISVGTGPIGVAADPATGQVFVADGGSNQLTIISDTTLQVVATVGTGSHPVDVAVDNTTDTIFVSNGDTQNFTVVDPTTDQVIGSAPVPAPSISLQGISYDWRTGEIWAGGGYSLAVELNASTLKVDGYWTTDPADATVDTDTGAVCLSNTGNTSLGCLYQTLTWNSTPLLFHPIGLPLGATWSIGIAQGSSTYHGNITNVTGTAANLSFGIWWYPPYAEYTYWITPGPGFSVTPPAGNVTIPSSAGSVVNLTFTSLGPTYSIWFNETGLPSGDRWSADLAGAFSPSSSSSVMFRLGNGSGYSYTIGGPAGYAPSPSSGTLTVAGSDQLVAITFQGTGAAAYPVSFSEVGLPSGAAWNVTINGTTFPTVSSVVSVQLPNGSYTATFGAPPGYRATDPTVAFDVAGSAIGIDVPFVPEVGGYAVTFRESGLPSGDLWGVTVGGTTLTTQADNATTSLSNGTYTFAVSAPNGFSPNPSGGTFTVAGNAVAISIVFTAAPARDVRLLFSEFGLPVGTGWSVSVSGATGSLVNGSYLFVVPVASYRYSVASPAGWRAYPANGTIEAMVNFTQYVTFVREATPFNATYSVTFSASGYPGGIAWTVTIGSTSYSSTTSNLSVTLVNGSYQYAVQGGPGPAVPSSGTFVVDGGPVSVHVTFTCNCPGSPPPGFTPPITVDSLEVGLIILSAGLAAIAAFAIVYSVTRPPRPPPPTSSAGPGPR